jgi:DNA replication protein DnaC
MELTTEQAHSLDLMLKWFGKKRRENYRLSGYAGTGKSYLVGKFLESIVSPHPIKRGAIFRD